jgi:hypothetical protein
MITTISPRTLSSARILLICVTFLWVGFVCAISFMEAWLKFQAPGVTLAIGLSIGKIVFSALNRVEIVLCSLVWILLIACDHLPNRTSWLFSGITLVLLAQTFWLLPALSSRIDLYLSGQTPPSSDHHLYFIAMEAIKVLALVVFGFMRKV